MCACHLVVVFSLLALMFKPGWMP